MAKRTLLSRDPSFLCVEEEHWSDTVDLEIRVRELDRRPGFRGVESSANFLELPRRSGKVGTLSVVAARDSDGGGAQQWSLQKRSSSSSSSSRSERSKVISEAVLKSEKRLFLE